MKKEIWKDILGYEGLYQVSNFGRVRSLDRIVKGCYNTIQIKKGRILKPRKNIWGYLYVVLSKENRTKAFTIHRLVALHFIDNPNNYPCVNHKDEDKLNNNVDNLEFCSVLYNNTYNERHKKIAEKNINGKKSKPVLQYTLDGVFVKEWESTREAGRNGYQQICISKCCRGINKQHKGFIWKYKEDI